MSPQFSSRPAARFRGRRAYYHSTDLYDALTGLLAAHGIAARRLDLKLRGRIVRQPRLDAYPGDAAASPGCDAVARLQAEGGPWTVLVRQEDAPIAEREPYDERIVWDRTRREDDAFVARGCAGARPIEVVTAVAVLAHNTLMPSPAGARWMLTQLTLERLLGPAQQDYFRCEIARRIGAAVTQSTLSDAEGVLGKAQFMLA